MPADVASTSLASLAQLENCHRRHDDVMETLVAAARRLAAGRPDTADVEHVHEAVTYFRSSVTRHFLDEEGSVFPRLSTRRPELAGELAALSAEHPTQVELQNQVAMLAEALDGDSRQGTGKRLLEVAETLAKAHRTHVTREDHLFEIAREALTAEDDAGIMAEMETRRDRRDELDTVRGVSAGRRKRAPTIADRPAALKTTKQVAAAKPKKPKKPNKPKVKVKAAKAVAKKKPKPAAKKAKKPVAKKSKSKRR